MPEEEEERGGAGDENSGRRRQGKEVESGKGDRKIGKREGRVGMAQDFGQEPEWKTGGKTKERKRGGARAIREKIHEQSSE